MVENKYCCKVWEILNLNRVDNFAAKGFRQID